MGYAWRLARIRDAGIDTERPDLGARLGRTREPVLTVQLYQDRAP